MRCNLKPLETKELQDYIHRRLQLAGANSHAAAIFPDETIALIQRVSRGLPRLVNTLCENSLLLGFGHNLQQITPDIVQEVAQDLCLDRVAEDSYGTFDESSSQPGVKSE